GRHFEKVDAAQEGAFAGPRGADHRHDVALMCGERNTLQHFEQPETLMQVANDHSGLAVRPHRFQLASLPVLIVATTVSRPMARLNGPLPFISPTRYFGASVRLGHRFRPIAAWPATGRGLELKGSREVIIMKSLNGLIVALAA